MGDEPEEDKSDSSESLNAYIAQTPDEDPVAFRVFKTGVSR